MDSFNLPPKPNPPSVVPGSLAARTPASEPVKAPAPGSDAGAQAALRRLAGDKSAVANPAGASTVEAGQALYDALPWDAAEAQEAPEPPPPDHAPPQPVRRSALSALPGAAPGAPARPLPGSPNPLAALEAKQPALAAAVADHLADPDTICQVPGKGTCVAATVQKALARQSPELYATMVQGLITGGVRLRGGQWLQASSANLSWIDAQGLTGKARVDALMQAALMELGAPGMGYSLADDRFNAQPTKLPGLSLDQARRLIEGLLKAPVLDPRDLKATWDEHHAALGLTPPRDPLDGELSAELARKLLERAEAGSFAVVRSRDNNGALLRDAAGRPLVEGLEDEEEEKRRKRPPKRSHMVQIIAVDEKENTVTYIDALGAQRTLPSTTFARIMVMTSRASELEGIGCPSGVASPRRQG